MHVLMALLEEKVTADEQMLVERDGKYELVDVQISTGQHQVCDGGVASSPPASDQPSECKETDNPKERREAEVIEKENLTAPYIPENKAEQNLVHRDEERRDSDSTTSKQAEPTTANGQRKGSSSNELSAVSTYALAGREKRVNLVSSRTKSAPGYRSRGEDQGEQKRRNEAAFSAWVAAKNEELAKRRQIEKQKCKIKEENQMNKQSLNEAAYQAWLQKKTSELQLQRKSASRPTTSIPKADEATKQAAFEAWIRSKRDQHQKQLQEEREKRLQEEDKARNSDPTLVDQAYKTLVQCTSVCNPFIRISFSTHSWLHRKRMQAKAEAQLKEQYRRAFFTESRRLHKSLQCHR